MYHLNFLLKVTSAAVHEDGYELSLTINFALRGNKDPLVGENTVMNREYLSTYTEGRKSSLSKYPSEESLCKYPTWGILEASFFVLHCIPLNMKPFKI